MIGNEQESRFRSLVDIFPCLASIVERVLGFKGQGHSPVITFTVYSCREALEPFHHDNLTAIFGIECHVGEDQLPIFFGLLEFSFTQGKIPKLTTRPAIDQL